jgi:hypothetical protein
MHGKPEEWLVGRLFHPNLKVLFCEGVVIDNFIFIWISKIIP